MDDPRDQQLPLDFERGVTLPSKPSFSLPASHSINIPIEEQSSAKVVTILGLRTQRKNSEEAEILNRALLRLEKLQA